MTQVALIADPDVPVDELTMAVWADALDKQLKEIASAWGVTYTPVVYYKTTDGLPGDGSVRIANVKMDLDTPGALGYHDVALDIVYSRELWQGPDETPTTVSHEDAEEVVDPFCGSYDPWDDNNEQAREISDRVEGDSYVVQGTVGETTRDVRLSNWLYPSAFDPNGKPPFDKMGMLAAWNGMTQGGYVILRSKATGDTTDVFARAGELAAAAAKSPSAASLLSNLLESLTTEQQVILRDMLKPAQVAMLAEIIGFHEQAKPMLLARHRRMPRIVPASPAAHAAILRRLARPESRLMRRLRAG